MTLKPRTYEEGLARSARYAEKRKAKLAAKPAKVLEFRPNSLSKSRRATKSLIESGTGDNQSGLKRDSAHVRPISRGRLRPRRFNKNPTIDGASLRDLKDECDNLVRSIIALRDEKCVNFDCRETEGLHVGHYIKRGVLAFRWDLRNCNAQCDFHNELHNTNPQLYQHAMILKYGTGITSILDVLGERNSRLTYVEILTIRDGLRQALVDLAAEQVNE